MFEEYEKNRRKQVSSMRALKDYTMGAVFVLIGAFFFFRNLLPSGIDKYLRPPDMVDKILGVVFFIYGSWRIYRGYKKNYFR
jgi:hypothetical protein